MKDDKLGVEFMSMLDEARQAYTDGRMDDAWIITKITESDTIMVGYAVSGKDLLNLTMGALANLQQKYPHLASLLVHKLQIDKPSNRRQTAAFVQGLIAGLAVLIFALNVILRGAS